MSVQCTQVIRGPSVGWVAGGPLPLPPVARSLRPAGRSMTDRPAGSLRLRAMALHPLASQFAAVADEYERGRPDYAPAVAGALAAELGLAPGAPVLDLGAGTG